jgi:tripartite-type tricarboxylate transporter receptor subunit TctC
MLRTQLAARVAVTAAAVLAASTGYTQNYPNHAIRIIAASAGSSGDVASRLIAAGIGPSLGQPIVVENHGGSVAVAAELAAKAQPDGYTLLYYPSSLWLFPLMEDRPTYDMTRDFAPVVNAGSSSLILVVHPSTSVKSVKELIALAKSRPGQLNYGSPSTGSATHIASELLKSMAHVNILRVPYKGTAPALNALVSGEVSLMFSSLAGALPFIKAGRVRGLAVSIAQPSPLAPGYPTVAASGLPGFEAVATQGMFAPANTPTAIIQRLNQEVVRYLNRPEGRSKFENAGIEVRGGTPDEFGATVKSEMSRLGKVIKEAGIKGE